MENITFVPVKEPVVTVGKEAVGVQKTFWTLRNSAVYIPIPRSSTTCLVNMVTELCKLLWYKEGTG